MNGKYQIVKLGDLGEFKNGVNFNSQQMGSGIPVINVKNITDSKRISSANLDLVDVDIKDEMFAKEGDVFFVRSSVKLDGIALSAKLNGITEKVTHCGFIIRFRPISKELDTDYLTYLLKCSHYRETLKGRSGGATIVNISQSALASVEIYLPPLLIQQKIARILTTYDDLIENNLKQIKLLEKLAQITYQEWFVRLRFPGHESTTFNPETGLPDGWEIKKVGVLIGNAPKSKKIKSSEIQNSGSIPVVDQSRDFVAGYTDDPESLINADHPIIVFGDHTRVLKFINFPFARGADGTQVIISNEKRMPQHLFYHSLLNLDLSDYHYARHYKFLKELEVVTPDLALANEYEQITKEQFDAVKNLRQQNQRLREACDILLPRLMTGVIDVESYDPTQLLKEAA